MTTDDVEGEQPRPRTRRRLGLPTVAQTAFITLLAVLGMLAGLLLASGKDKYQSDSQIFVTSSGVEGANNLLSTSLYIQGRMPAYASAVTSPSVLDPVISQLRLRGDASALARNISTDSPLNSNILNIHVTDARAGQAQTINRAVTTSFISYIAKTETKVGPRSSTAIAGLKFTPVHPASLPTSPKTAPRVLFLLIGLLAGFVVGALLVAAYGLLKKRLGTTHDLALLDNAPVVGLLPFDKRSKDVTVFADRTDRRAEPYRLMRTNIVFGDIDQRARIIAVTGPQGGEGVSTVAANLAAALAELGVDVCLLECDQRKPSLAERFGLDPEVGLSAVLSDEATIEDVKQDTGSGFSVVTAGASGRDPEQLLEADKLRSAFVAAAGSGYVVVDAPPLLPFAGGAEASRVADVTLVVVRARKTLRTALERAVEGLEQSRTYGGIVLNAATGRGVERRARKVKPLTSRASVGRRAEAVKRRRPAKPDPTATQFPLGRADVAGRAPVPAESLPAADFRPSTPARAAVPATDAAARDAVDAVGERSEPTTQKQRSGRGRGRRQRAALVDEVRAEDLFRDAD